MLFAKRKKGVIYEDPTKPGLRRRLINTVLLLLGFRLLANIPLANVDEERMHELLAQNPLLAAIDLFAGGDVLRSFSIVAVGLFPYLLAAGVVRLAAWVIPPLRTWVKDAGKEHRRRVERAVTLPVALLVAWGLTRYLALETGRFPARLAWFTVPGLGGSLVIIAVMTFGAWLTEKIKDAITKHGIGSGESLILLVGASLSLVTWVADVGFGGGDAREIAGQLAISAIMALLVIVLSIPLLVTTRDIPMTLPRAAAVPSRLRDRLPPTFLPLKLNRGGTGPVSSAIGLLWLFQMAAMAVGWAFPGRFTAWQQALLSPTRPENGLYWALLATLIVAFTYVYNFGVLWKPFADSDKSLAETLRTDPGHAFVTGIRPGTQTERYLGRVIGRITPLAALLLAFLTAGLPYLLFRLTGVNAAIAILAEIVFVKCLLELRDSYRLYHTLDRGYEGFLRR